MIRSFFALALVALASIGSIVVRAVDYALSVFEPYVPRAPFIAASRLAVPGFTSDQVDAATFHGLRHESRVHRSSANRNI